MDGGGWGVGRGGRRSTNVCVCGRECGMHLPTHCTFTYTHTNIYNETIHIINFSKYKELHELFFIVVGIILVASHAFFEF